MQQLEAWAGLHPWSWLFTGAWALMTFWMGLREQWRELERLLGGGIRENTRVAVEEMPAAERGKPVPRYDPEDGFWYVSTYDKETGLPDGKRRVDAPNLTGPTINRARLGMFNR